jgi:hypothetical protein
MKTLKNRETAFDQVVSHIWFRDHGMELVADLVTAGWMCPGTQFGTEPHHYKEEDRRLRGTGRRCEPCMKEGIWGKRAEVQIEIEEEEIEEKEIEVRRGTRVQFLQKGPLALIRRLRVTSILDNFDVNLCREVRTDSGWVRDNTNFNIVTMPMSSVKERLQNWPAPDGLLTEPLALYPGFQVRYQGLDLSIIRCERGAVLCLVLNGKQSSPDTYTADETSLRTSLGPEWSKE